MPIKKVIQSSSKRGRPSLTEHQRKETQNKIVQAARELFATYGYAAVSMRKLAEAVKCTPMTLYSYFESKIDILRYLWADVFADLFKQIDQVRAKTNQPELELATISQTYVEFWVNHPEQYRMVFLSAQVSQPEVSVFMRQDAVALRYEVFFPCLVNALAHNGHVINPKELKCRAETLICALNGIAHNLITISDYPWEKPELLVNTIVRAITCK